MADAEPKRATSSVFIVAGVVAGIIVTIAAFLVEVEYGLAVLVLLVVMLGAALAYRVITERGGAADDADSTDNVPRQEPRGERPLGDTPEAHDEISPHDLPLDHPGREEAEELAGGPEGTTRGGPLPGG